MFIIVSRFFFDSDLQAFHVLQMISMWVLSRFESLVELLGLRKIAQISVKQCKNQRRQMLYVIFVIFRHFSVIQLFSFYCHFLFQQLFVSYLLHNDSARKKIIEERKKTKNAERQEKCQNLLVHPNTIVKEQEILKCDIYENKPYIMLWYSLVHVFYNILTLKFSVQLICAVFGTNFKLPEIFYFPQQTCVIILQTCYF